jgi:protein TIF31
MDIDFKHYSLTNLQSSNLFEDQGKPQRYKCLNSIYYSHFNQDMERMNTEQGYLCFIVVNTLENVEYNITGTVRGFFVNSTVGLKFSPMPATPLQQSYTLVGLLSLISSQFKENFTKLMTQVLTVDPLFFLPTPNNRFDWLKPKEDSHFYNYIHKFGDNLTELHEGKKPTREWNEELQAVFDLKIPNSIENLQKEKLLSSLYNNFKESAVEVNKS